VGCRKLESERGCNECGKKTRPLRGGDEDSRKLIDREKLREKKIGKPGIKKSHRGRCAVDRTDGGAKAQPIEGGRRINIELKRTDVAGKKNNFKLE